MLTTKKSRTLAAFLTLLLCRQSLAQQVSCPFGERERLFGRRGRLRPQRLEVLL
jgi:hypothetical protein